MGQGQICQKVSAATATGKQREVLVVMANRGVSYGHWQVSLGAQPLPHEDLMATSLLDGHGPQEGQRVLCWGLGSGVAALLCGLRGATVYLVTKGGEDKEDMGRLWRNQKLPPDHLWVGPAAEICQDHPTLRIDLIVITPLGAEASEVQLTLAHLKPHGRLLVVAQGREEKEKLERALLGFGKTARNAGLRTFPDPNMWLFIIEAG